MKKNIKKLFKKIIVKGGLEDTQISEEEFKRILDAGKKSGALDKTEHELIKSILEFTDTTAKEIMVPRPDVVALEISMNPEKIVNKVIEDGFSRLPVYVDDLDKIIGIVYTKDLINVLEHHHLIILQDIIRPAYFVPETTKISALLREFQQQKIHLAIVVDEFGGTVGIITMEDIIEEIVGEIHDEYDEVKKTIEPERDGSFVIDAAMTISEFNRQFNGSLPEGQDYETLAGYLQKITQRFPEINEEIIGDRYQFTILSKSARRIRQVKVKQIDQTNRGKKSHK